MKHLVFFNLALSFSCLVMLDIEASSLWALLIVLVWFAASAVKANKVYRKYYNNN